MVRTGDRCVRVGGGKSSSKKGGGGSSSSATPKGKSSGKSMSSIGGNPICQREKPDWQKPITCFFPRNDHPKSVGGKKEDLDEQGPSSSEASGSQNIYEETKDSDELKLQTEFPFSEVSCNGLSVAKIETVSWNGESSDNLNVCEETEDLAESEKQTESSSHETSYGDLTVDEIEILCSLRRPGLSRSDDLSSLEDSNDVTIIQDTPDSPDTDAYRTSSDGTISESNSEYVCDDETARRKRKPSPIGSPESPDYESLDGNDDIIKSPVKRIKLDENISENNNVNKEECKTPTAEKKRKSTINILTPKRIHSHS